MNILITGENSFIGTSFTRFAAEMPQHTLKTVSLRDNALPDIDFSNIDTVFHVAGIAHVDYGRPTDEQKKLYRKVNTELPIETAKRAKNAGVRQFIFMSSSIVYNKYRNKKDRIGPNTIPSPNSVYGFSKLNAENGLLALSDDTFRVCIIRSPLVYGPGCKGNYPTLSKAAHCLPFFPLPSIFFLYIQRALYSLYRSPVPICPLSYGKPRSRYILAAEFRICFDRYARSNHSKSE